MESRSGRENSTRGFRLEEKARDGLFSRGSYDAGATECTTVAVSTGRTHHLCTFSRSRGRREPQCVHTYTYSRQTTSFVHESVHVCTCASVCSCACERASTRPYAGWETCLFRTVSRSVRISILVVVYRTRHNRQRGTVPRALACVSLPSRGDVSKPRREGRKEGTQRERWTCSGEAWPAGMNIYRGHSAERLATSRRLALPISLSPPLSLSPSSPT